MFVKIHKTYRDIIAICDSELIGKTFEEGKFQLDVKESFYKGEKVSEEKAVEIMQKIVSVCDVLSSSFRLLRCKYSTL